ncbi:MAG: hypothetical protein ACREOE_04225, partial [Gemmatimonadales bacterium]
MTLPAEVARCRPRTRLALLAATASLALLSCGGLRARMASANDATCGEVLRRFPQVSSDPGYPALPSESRGVYEIRVARCAL